LEGAELTGVTLAFARLSGAQLGGARGLAAEGLRGAKLVGARGLDLGGLAGAGAAPPVPGKVAPMWAHRAGCSAVAWSPSGDLVASGQGSGVILLWDAGSGQAIRAFEGHMNWVQSVVFSPDGTTLASGSWDNTVRLWEVSSGRTLRAFEGHTKSVQSVA